MHPKTCFTEETGNKRCVVKRHRECSDGCTSPVVSIQEGGERGCQYIRNYPYAYCGNYQRLNCGDCYYCNGRYNPSECSRQSTCPSACKNNMPGCVQTPEGTVCS
ncbi:hypothetical protein MTP99_001635 [Tenebrio molitor]|nr:hypothetical protein MTP99_001635 [Tenebrio molitor]